MSLPSLNGKIETPDLALDNIHMSMQMNAHIDKITADMKVLGDREQPLSMLMLGDSTKPISMMMQGDSNKPISMMMMGDGNKPISMMMLGNAEKPLSMLIKGDPKNPVAASIELVNLPRFTVSDIQKLTSMRISLPGHHQMCFKVMGRELFSLCLSGEGQAITQPYVPNAYERCEVSCCDEDTTPFPTTGHVTTTGGVVAGETVTPTK